MHYFSCPLLLLLILAACTLAGELPAVEPPPVEPLAGEPPSTLDPIPPVVRSAATKLGREGSIALFDVITQRRTLYQVRLVEVATNRPALATFAADGSLVSLAEIPPHEPPALLEPPTGLIATPQVKPVPDSADPDQPHRTDGRDAAPTTRRGIDEPVK